MANNGNGNGQVVVSGGSGSTTVQATATSTKINGGDGNDLILGGSQIDDIRAGNGNDTIVGGAGNDIIFGNDGYDVAKISDLSTLSVAAGQSNALIATSSDGVDTLKQIEAISDGTNTYIVGQNNGIFGLGNRAATTENNTVTINAFAAAFDVEDDAFSIISATSSTAGAAVSFAAGGSLTYTPGTLFDHLAVGATATDTFSYTVKDAAGNSTTQTVTVTLTGTNDAPTITGGTTSGSVSEDGTLSASGSLTATDVDSGATQSWSVQGGGAGNYGALSVDNAGGWSYALANGSSAVQALAAGQSVSDSFTVEVSDGNGGTDTEVVNITIAGANDAPTITGTSGNDTLIGTGDNDIVTGLEGHDVIDGGVGNDSLSGGDGSDYLIGGDGNDLIDGGADNDAAVYDGAASGVVVDLTVQGVAQNTGGGGIDTLISIEHLVGSHYSDTLIGDTSDNTLFDVYGGDDQLFGNDGNDYLLSGQGNDTLDGGLGTDTLNAGAGSDSFQFSTALGSTNIDEISDFDAALDVYRLDHAIFINIEMGTLAPDAFAVGAAATTADQRVIYNHTTGQLYYDADGSGGTAAIQFAALYGAPGTVTSDDFLVY